MWERRSICLFTLKSFPAGTAQERMPDKEFRNSMGRSQFTPLWTVTNKARIFKVAKPIKVRIYSEDNLFC